jgi:membrane protein YdbS with pleckstrin-like domain
MLPSDRKAWSRRLAVIEIAITLVAAVAIPILLYHLRALDPPIVVGIILLLFAILPSRVHALSEHPDKPEAPRPYASRPAHR